MRLNVFFMDTAISHSVLANAKRARILGSNRVVSSIIPDSTLVEYANVFLSNL